MVLTSVYNLDDWIRKLRSSTTASSHFSQEKNEILEYFNRLVSLLHLNTPQKTDLGVSLFKEQGPNVAIKTVLPLKRS